MFHHNIDDPQIDGPTADQVVTPVYENALSDILGVIGTSRVCRQYVGLESRNSRVFDERMTPLKWWVSATNENMMNWGAPTGLYGCSCGVTGSELFQFSYIMVILY